MFKYIEKNITLLALLLFSTRKSNEKSFVKFGYNWQDVQIK